MGKERKTLVGTVNFSNLTKHDVFQGQDTDYFNVTVTLSPEDAADLEAQGVTIKDYQGNKQRKFKTKHQVNRYDAAGEVYEGEVPYNSKVRIRYSLGDKHPIYGVPTYLEGLKVLEEAETTEDDSEFRYG